MNIHFLLNLTDLTLSKKMKVPFIFVPPDRPRQGKLKSLLWSRIPNSATNTSLKV